MVTKIVGVMGASVDPNSGDLVVGFQGPSIIALQLRRGMVKTLIATLTGLLTASREKYGTEADFQPIAFTGTHQYRDQNGFSHLELILEGQLRIPLTFDKTTLAGLKNALDELERTGKIRPPPTLN